MSRYSISIPQNVLDDEIVYGLSFEEIVSLLAIPLIIVLPAIFIRAIPIWVILVMILVGFLMVGGIIIASPAGQSPVTWFPKYLRRRINPDKYQLKPQDHTEFGTPNVVYRDVVHTAPMLEEEFREKQPDGNLVQDYIYSIKYAERLAIPDEINVTIQDLVQEFNMKMQEESTENEEEDRVVFDKMKHGEKPP